MSHQPILKTENLTFRYTTEEGAAPTVLDLSLIHI